MRVHPTMVHAQMHDIEYERGSIQAKYAPDAYEMSGVHGVGEGEEYHLDLT